MTWEKLSEGSDEGLSAEVLLVDNARIPVIMVKAASLLWLHLFIA